MVIEMNRDMYTRINHICRPYTCIKGDTALAFLYSQVHLQCGECTFHQMKELMVLAVIQHLTAAVSFCSVEKKPCAMFMGD